MSIAAFMLPATRAGACACGAASRAFSSSPISAPSTTFEAFYAGVQGECAGELAAYGACVSKNLEGLERGVCAPEFAALRACADTSLASTRAARRSGSSSAK